MKKIIKVISYSFLAISSTIIFNACNKNNDSSDPSVFEVSFVHDGTKIVKQVEAGGSISIDEIGLPQAREHYTASWDLNGISLENINSNITVNAKYVPVNYEVKWLDYDDSEIEIDLTPYNSVPSFDSDNPIREKDAQYEYVFSGWDKDITSPIEGNTIFKAQYSTTIRKYLVSFSDGNTIIKTQQYEYGQTPSFEGTPSKEKDEQYSYSFASWDKQFTAVTQNITYTALWNQTLNEYSVRFVDGDNNDSVILEQTLPYGTEIEAPSFPVATQGYHYEWDKDIDDTVTKDVTYTRSYKPNTDTPYKVEIYSPKYVASVGDNQKFKEESLEMIDITSDFKDLLQLDENNKGKGTTDTVPDFEILNNLPDVFRLDESNSSHNQEISGDGTTIYKFTYDINWSSLGFDIDDLVSGYLLGGYNHSGSYISLGRAYVENEDNSIAGLKVHYDFDGKTGNGTNFAITIDHLDVNMYESIAIRYGAFSANSEGSYWAARMVVKGEGDNTPETNWPLSGHTYQNYEVRTFDAINQLSICPDLTHVDAIKFVYQAYGSISNMSEAGHTDYYILGLDIIEKSDNLTITFKDGQEILSTRRIANGAKVNEPSEPLKDGYFFTGWYQEDLTTLFDFNASLDKDTIVCAKFEEAVQYKVSIETEYYTRNGNANGTFDFPNIKQYHDATSEFATDLGLSYDSNGNFYYGYGKLGTSPDFEVLSNLPEIYHLEGDMPTDTISNDIVTYSFKYSIDEQVLGYPLSKIHVSYAYDNTIYDIGLLKDGNQSGFMVKVEQSMQKAYSTPISIIFDDIEVSLYEQVSISGTAKFKNTSRNIKWYVNGELKTYKDDSLVATWINQSYTNYNVDALAVMESTGQSILKQVDARPAVAPDNDNSLTLYVDKIVVKEKPDNHIVTFKDDETTSYSSNYTSETSSTTDTVTLTTTSQVQSALTEEIPLRTGYYFKKMLVTDNVVIKNLNCKE